MWNSENPRIYSSFKDLKITVTGGAGFLGRHVVQELLNRGADRKNIFIPRSNELDLRVPEQAKKAVVGQDLVLHLAASVGGIGYNQKKPGDLIYNNMMMGFNVIHESQKAGVQKILVVGTVCAYPKFAPVPFKEEDLWNGYPEETNAPYGVAKKSLLVMLQSYRQQYDLHGIYLLPVNLYGPHDNFDLESSHVIPALIRKFHEAKVQNLPFVEIWGDGSPSREFLYVEDCARAIVLGALKYDGPEPINLGTNSEVKISDLAHLVSDVVGYKGDIKWNASKPNGQPRRQLDVSRAKEAFGFEAQMNLSDGLKKTADWYLRTRPEKT